MYECKIWLKVEEAVLRFPYFAIARLPGFLLSYPFRVLACLEYKYEYYEYGASSKSSSGFRELVLGEMEAAALFPDLPPKSRPFVIISPIMSREEGSKKFTRSLQKQIELSKLLPMRQPCQLTDPRP